MWGMETVICAHCGNGFYPPSAMGPKPTYCGQTCRQRAFEVRRIDRLETDRGMWKAEAKRLAQSLNDWGYGDYDEVPHDLEADGTCRDCGEAEFSCPYRKVSS
jgi:hypothetical protein